MSNVPLPEPHHQSAANFNAPDEPFYTADQMHAHAAAVSAAKDERIKVLEDALRAIDKQCFSHVDGRDLFAQMHPRNTLDIKRRVDARETWFEGDWLTDLWTAIKAARAALAARKGEA